jgi:hypothetical protein
MKAGGVSNVEGQQSYSPAAVGPKRRGELVERSFAHCYETGGLRRCHLRGRENILKRQLIHVGALNLSLILRKLLGAGTPREIPQPIAPSSYTHGHAEIRPSTTG